MTPVTPAQLFAILVFAAVFLGINFGFWRWSNRGHDRLTLAVEDQTPDHGQSALADIFGGWMCVCGQGSWTTYGCTAAVREQMICGVRYVRGPELTYICDQLAGHGGRMHADHSGGCKVEWYADGDISLLDDPKPTLGQERLYDAEGLVQYGLELVDRRCLDARRDFATDLICPACAKVFGTVTA